MLRIGPLEKMKSVRELFGTTTQPYLAVIIPDLNEGVIKESYLIIAEGCSKLLDILVMVQRTRPAADDCRDDIFVHFIGRGQPTVIDRTFSETHRKLRH